MSEEMKDTSNVMNPANAEDIALSVFTDEEIREYEEGTLTGKEKAKFLLLTPLTNCIIKFCLIGLGLIGAILWLVGMLVPNALNGLYQGYTGVLAAINNVMPFSVFELVIILSVIGWLGYLIYVLVRFIQVYKNGKLLGARMWIQFGYSTLALALIYTMLFSFGYGIVSSRSSFHKASAYDDGTTLYSYANVKETELSEALLYTIDKLNTTVINANTDPNNQLIGFSGKTGSSLYNVKGNKVSMYSQDISAAFQKAAQDIPALKGSKIVAKEMLAGPVFTAMTVGSMYAPVTGEVLVNPYYPNVSQPMLIAKAIAKQRGFQSDAQADMIAYLVCTRYCENPYVQYSAYFNAYLSIGSKLAMRNASTYATMASALKEDIKKEVIFYTRKLDSLYGNKSSLQFTDSSNGLTAAEHYLEYPELLINYYRQRLAVNADDSAELPCGYYVNSLVDLYRQDLDYQTQIQTVVAKYAQYREEIKQETVPGTSTEGTAETPAQ